MAQKVIEGHNDILEFELKTRDQYFEEKVKEKLCGSNFMLARVIVSFDDLLSHLKIPCVTQFLIFFL